MSKSRIGLLAMATVAVVAVLTIGGVAFAQAQGAPTPGPQAQAQASGGAWIGVGLADLNDKVAARIGVSGTVGVAIVQVVAKGPAADAGLQVGDIVTSVDGKSVAKAQEVVAAVKAKTVGDKIAFAVSRKGSSLQITVTAAAVPQAPQRGTTPGTTAPGAAGRGNGGFDFGFMGRGGFGFGGLLDGLKGIPGADVFGHLFGWQFKFTDKDGKAVTVKTIPGIVVSATKDSLTIKPNDSSESGGPYAITADTKVQLPGRATVDSLKAGDKVVVVTTDGKTAISVTGGATGSQPNGSGNPRTPQNGLRDRIPKQAPTRGNPLPSGTSS
jgi:membrane-associated protease RseP (regulator of RpoE activity)